jgi:hypothetical protein
MDEMHRRFLVNRIEDVSGVSGTGIVAEGCQFHDGRIAWRWISDSPSWGLADSIDEMISKHGHKGKTEIIWRD